MTSNYQNTCKCFSIDLELSHNCQLDRTELQQLLQKEIYKNVFQCYNIYLMTFHGLKSFNLDIGQVILH